MSKRIAHTAVIATLVAVLLVGIPILLLGWLLVALPLTGIYISSQELEDTSR